MSEFEDEQLVRTIRQEILKLPLAQAEAALHLAREIKDLVVKAEGPGVMALALAAAELQLAAAAMGDSTT